MIRLATVIVSTLALFWLAATCSRTTSSPLVALVKSALATTTNSRALVPLLGKGTPFFGDVALIFAATTPSPAQVVELSLQSTVTLRVPRKRGLSAAFSPFFFFFFFFVFFFFVFFFMCGVWAEQGSRKG